MSSGESWEHEAAEIKRRHQFAEAMGGAEAVRLRHEKGFLTVRERIAGIVDRGSFQEVGKLSGKGRYDSGGKLSSVTPAPYVMGVAEIDGRPVAIGGEDTTIRGGTIKVDGKDATRVGQSGKLNELGIAYLLQGNSVFPDMTVEQNLQLGGYLKGKRPAREAADGIFDLYPRLAARRKQPARMLSGGERRLLEIARALVMNPRILLVDEPSIGLEPRYTQMIFELLRRLQRERGMSILMVEQNVRVGLQFADVGYALVAGKVVAVAPSGELLGSPAIQRLFVPT